LGFRLYFAHGPFYFRIGDFVLVFRKNAKEDRSPDFVKPLEINKNLNNRFFTDKAPNGFSDIMSGQLLLGLELSP